LKKTDRCVVRNGAYKKSEFSIRERHNERLNECYYNADIELDRKNLNVYFKQSEGSYAETFEKMLADGTITVKGLKTDGRAKVFDELVFDVNTDYFERNGGYEYAKSFFEEAYRLAIKEIGGEQYVLSAVMHADERNKALSEHYGRDVYHYHLHVVYIPVVDKDVLWTKRCKDPELVGTVKETIKQVSHSKKWPKLKQYHENGEVVRNAKGKAELLNSYSLLQDSFAALIRKYFDVEELDAPMLNELVSKIEVHEREIADGERVQKVDIYYNFVGIINQARECRTAAYHWVEKAV